MCCVASLGFFVFCCVIRLGFEVLLDGELGNWGVEENRVGWLLLVGVFMAWGLFEGWWISGSGWDRRGEGVDWGGVR